MQSESVGRPSFDCCTWLPCFRLLETAMTLFLPVGLLHITHGPQDRFDPVLRNILHCMQF